jgi:putative membrane protein
VKLGLASLLGGTWMHGEWGWGWMVLMMAVMLLFWGAVIAGIVWLIRGAGSGPWPREPNAGKETPVEILDRRFAEGEISEEDYRARREVLTGRASGVGTT